MGKVILSNINAAIPDPIGLHNSGGSIINPATNEKLDELKTLLSQIESAVDELEIKADTINLNTDDLESKIQAVKDQLDVLLSTRASEITTGLIKTNLDDIKTKIGEVQASPTTNTILARLKDLYDKLTDLLGNGNSKIKIWDGTNQAVITNQRLKVSTELEDNASLDAFSRLRTSKPRSLFDCQFEYGLQPFLMDTITLGGGTAIHLPNESAVSLNVGTSLGDKVIRQSRQYFRYQPGKSQSILLTIVIGSKKTGVRQRAGYFDDNNGLFLEQDFSNLKLVKRSFATGTVVDVAVNQSSWNIDKLDGTGLSGIILDTSKTQIMVIDLQWLGVGRVRLGFDIAGKIYYCHEFLHANILTVPYMTTANLPIRYELENIAATTSATSLKQICANVNSEGGLSTHDTAGYIFSVFNSPSRTVTNNILLPMISLRLKSLFSGKIPRNDFFIEGFGLLTSADCRWELIRNTTLTGAIFVSADVDSTIEYDISATALSGGKRIFSGFNQTRADTIISDIGLKYPFTMDALGTTSDIITLALISLTGNSSSYASLTWREVY